MTTTKSQEREDEWLQVAVWPCFIITQERLPLFQTLTRRCAMGFPLIPLPLLPVPFLAPCLACRPGKVEETATGGGDTQGRLAPQPESPQNWLETLWLSFQSTQLGKEPAWRDNSHSNSHSQSSRWDQVYSGTTGKPHSLGSKPQFFSLAIPPGFSGKGKNCIKRWCCFSFPLSFPVCTFITFNTEFFSSSWVYLHPPAQLLF